MTIGKEKSRFYVVGGPVQPSHPSYILRDADALLYTRLIEQDYCFVLAPYHTGKTSLMAHTAARLRSDGYRVATLDLGQIGNRETTDDEGRWYYSLAYRIVRELRIRSNMQAWWQERSGLTNVQRLREFFLEVVLDSTDQQIVIFVDRIEVASERLFVRQLLGTIRACYDARATDPEYERLTFAMLGSASVGKRVPGDQDSPFDVATEIPLGDFDTAELRQLAGGLAADQATTNQLTNRIWYWTSGHPYLSQKILRGLTRRSGEQLSAATVDEIVSRLFLGRNATREEPHLLAAGKNLLRESSRKVARLSLYGRFCKGGKVVADTMQETHRDLLGSGIVVTDTAGNLAKRNRVYEQVFTAQWVNQNLPFGWQGFATAAVIAIILFGGPVWYSQYLPRPYIKTLTEPEQDYVTAFDAYRRLHFFPGFGNTANQLFSDYLTRQSRGATRLPEVERLNEQLAEIPRREELGEELLAEFWDRRAQASMGRGDRDSALLFATRALAMPTLERRKLVAELLGTDHGSLQGTIRTPEPLRQLEIDHESGLITTLDEKHNAAVWQMTANGPQRIQRVQLLAEEVIPLQRRLVYQGGGGGRRLIVDIKTDHSRPADISVELRAPSGRQVTLSLAANSATGNAGEFRFDSSRSRELRPLLEENINGTWVGYFTDAAQGVGGSLLSWELRIDGEAAVPPPGVIQEPTLIPEPGVARQANSLLSSGGRRALTWPADPAVRGEILVWNVAGGEILARIPRPAQFSGARFARGQTAVLVTGARTIELWDTEHAALLKSIPIEPSLTPVLSGNGRFLVVGAVLGDTNNALTVWDLDKQREVGQLVTGQIADLVSIDSAGRFLAVGDGDRLVRLWSVPDGALLREFEHGATPVSIDFDGEDKWLATQDGAHTFRLWSLEDKDVAPITRDASTPWSVSLSSDAMLLGSLDRGFEVIGLPQGVSQGEGFLHGVPIARTAPADFTARALLAPGHGMAVTYDGEQAVKFWRLPLLSNSADAEVGSRPAAQGHVAAVSRDRAQLAISTEAGDVRILPLTQQPLLLPGPTQAPGFIGHLAPVTRIAFDASGALIASGSFDGSVRVWDTSSGAPRDFFSSHADGAIKDLVFTQDVNRLIFATRTSVMAIDTQTGELLAQTGIQSEKPRLSVSTDGQRIYIAGDRGGLTRWVWRGGVTEPLIGAEAAITRIALSADERFIVTADANRWIRVWDAALMTPLSRRVRAPAAVDDLWLVSDDLRVVVQAGVWLCTLSVNADGLAKEAMRLLEHAPAVVYPDSLGTEAFVLTRSHSSRPLAARIPLIQSWAEPVDESLAQLMPGVESDLGLTLNDWGEAQPLQQF